MDGVGKPFAALTTSILAEGGARWWFTVLHDTTKYGFR